MHRSAPIYCPDGYLKDLQKRVKQLESSLPSTQAYFPAQSGNNGRILSTTGNSPVWIDIPIASGVFDMINSLKDVIRIHPTYIPPVLSLSSTQSSANLEVGQTVNIPLVANFAQNDAGSIVATSIQQDDVTVSSSNTFTPTSIMSVIPKVFTATASYDNGTTKLNNLGDLDTFGKIQAGTISSNSLSYRGYYYFFFGPVSGNPTTPDDIRALSSKQIETNKTVILNTGSTNASFAIWIPQSYIFSSVRDLDALNADITSNYTLISGNFNGKDASGTLVPGKLYVMTQSIPYSSNHRHQITIQ